ncbi:hypothetical protein C8J56DRAFT_770822 [Mycena floridula]|nr:hypothetical protein C8J56DRAFT_770822 [Mycena floridula]
MADDPRNAALETKFVLPSTWARESSDVLGSSGMLLSGLIMVTRNRYLAWPSLAFAINAFFNQHPMRSKDGGSGAFSNLALCLMALLTSYIPLFMVTNSPSAPPS